MTTQTPVKDWKLDDLRLELRLQVLDAQTLFAERIAKHCLALLKIETPIAESDEADLLEMIQMMITEDDLLEKLQDAKFSMHKYLKVHCANDYAFKFCDTCGKFIGLESGDAVSEAEEFRDHKERQGYEYGLLCPCCVDAADPYYAEER